jgi:hypothetical protein
MGEPPEPPTQWIPYDIPLRRGTGRSSYAHLLLPQDMKQSEADRICGVIQVLAFPDA